MSRSEFVEHAAAVFMAQGFPPMPARVLIALTASDEGRLTSEELQSELGVSAAAVSHAVTYLETVGMLFRATEPGGRRQVYRLGSTSSWYTASLDRREQMLGIAAVFRQGRNSLPEGSPARERIEEIAEFFEFLARRMPELLQEWNDSRK
jgi:DNA-binding transcriptional regulator GbsR (MarR family)